MEQGLARWAHNPKVGGSNPSPANFLRLNSICRGVEQGLARWAHNPKVRGSNPFPAISSIYLEGGIAQLVRAPES